jgi:hypothetical protein
MKLLISVVDYRYIYKYGYISVFELICVHPEQILERIVESVNLQSDIIVFTGRNKNIIIVFI